MQGQITYFNAARGFGFITVAPEGRRIFFHISNFQKDAEPVLQGLVDFELGPPIAVGKSLQALKVRYLSAVDELLSGLGEKVSIGGAQ
jgi:cold shock CspA family protein